MSELANVERDLLRFLRRILTVVALYAASPFLMFALLGFLLGWPQLVSLVLLAIALLLYAVAAVVYLVVRARLRAVRQTAELADSPFLRGPP